MVCLALTPAFRRLAKTWGLMDHPDGRRKIHALPVPVCGGVAVYASATVILLLLTLFTTMTGLPSSWNAFISDPLKARKLAALFAAATVLACIGIFDDRFGIRGRFKLVGQVIAASIVICGGVMIDKVNIFDYQLDLNYFAIPITLIWLLLAINSLNLIDGLDGLLGTVGLILCCTIGVMTYLNWNADAAIIAFTMAGALTAFLCYNFPPATIYLGDAGSMLIGLVVGTLAIQASVKGPAVGIMAPLALMALPIFDTSAAIVRRSLTGRSIYTTDRGHLHHVMMGNGLSNVKVVLAIGVICTFLAAFALVTVHFKSDMFSVVAIAAVVAFLIVFKMFGHSEFLLIKDRVSGMVSSLRPGRKPNGVRQVSFAIQGSANWAELWRELVRAADELQLKSLVFDINAPALHEQYHARWERDAAQHDELPTSWRVETPLTVDGKALGKLVAVGQRDGESAWRKLAVLAKLVEDIELAIGEIAAQHPSRIVAGTVAPARSAEGLQHEHAEAGA